MMRDFKALLLRLKDRERLVPVLIANLHESQSTLEALWAEINDRNGYENLVYRFYHQSFKAFRMQEDTERMAAALRAVAPEGREFHRMFRELLAAGTGKKFDAEVNNRWVEVVGPIITAYFHARYVLEMAVRVAAEPDPDGAVIGYPWAMMLELFDLR